MNDLIYLDHHATTPCDPRVVEAMLPFFGAHFGNASSAHAPGRAASEAVENARVEVALLIGARAAEIFFTSGATESDNLAIMGVARAWGDKRRRIVTSAVEHKAVLETCRALEREGFELVVLPVDRVGRVEMEAARAAIDERTLLVAIQAANHEIGTIQPMSEIAAWAHQMGAPVFCDAAQAVGKIALNVNAWNLDLLALSAHKIYGPKGVGALWVRGGKRAGLAPLFHGGGQERGLRSGTLNVPGIVGLGEACRLCREEMDAEAKRLAAHRDRFEATLLSLPNVTRNGDLNNRLPHGSSLTFAGVEAQALLSNLPDLALSTGSACASGAWEPSPVLSALGMEREAAYSTIRVGLGRFTTALEGELAAHAIAETVARLRVLWE